MLSTFSSLQRQDRTWVEPLLARSPSELGSRTFAGLYLWGDHFEYRWTWIEGYWCVFAGYGPHTYMPWPPLPGPDADVTRWPTVVAAVLAHMEASPDEGAAARIDGVDEKERGAFTALGYDLSVQATEFVYPRAALVSLRGDEYKPKRWAWNYFFKHHVFRVEPLRPHHADACLDLYGRWRDAKRWNDPYAVAMARDAESAHYRALTELDDLGLTGLTVTIGDRIEGYTVGGPVGPGLFGVFLEIANPEMKGLSSYLFREFCRAQTGVDWITAMDDSGLPALTRAKTSYRPSRLVRSWSIRRRGAAR